MNEEMMEELREEIRHEYAVYMDWNYGERLMTFDDWLTAELYKRGYYELDHFIEVAFAPLLGYYQEQPGDPGYTEGRVSYATGDNVPESLVLDAVHKIRDLTAENARLREIAVDRRAFTANVEDGPVAVAREQVAREIEAEVGEPHPSILGFDDGLQRAARIARGGVR